MTRHDVAAVFVPIKFRCNYCRQFLGISRAQAGGVVDCPTCGRSIRVPLLDGSVQPMEEPELNLEDTHLTRALDELARLVDAPIEQLVPTKKSREDNDEAENQIPQPLPEPIPIEVPLPPTPIVVQSPTNVALSSPSENGAPNERALLAELASLSAGAPVGEPSEKPLTSTISGGRRRQAEFSPLMVSVYVLAIFLAGMLTERFLRIFEGRHRTDASTSNATEKPPAENEMTGRITYKTKEGESLPDRGARVLVFPQNKTGQVKLSVIGFRPADGEVDQSIADAELKALGGAAATVDSSGAYHLSLAAGSYHVLVLSHFQPRDDAATDPELEKLLAEYFDNPSDLLGRVEVQFAPLRLKGTGDVWDYSF